MYLFYFKKTSIYAHEWLTKYKNCTLSMPYMKFMPDSYLTFLCRKELMDYIYIRWWDCAGFILSHWAKTQTVISDVHQTQQQQNSLTLRITASYLRLTQTRFTLLVFWCWRKQWINIRDIPVFLGYIICSIKIETIQ